MTGPGRVLAEAAALARARQPFVLASVVWRRGPTSGRAGSKALILADGTVRGWIGGACAEPTVIEQARRCLQCGEAVLLSLGEGCPASPADQSVLEVAMACESDGALQVFLEPMVPAVHVIGIGRSPAVDALASMALAIGWDATVVDDGGRADEHPHPEIVRTKLDLADMVVDERTAIVVGTQGHYDDIALAAALRTPAPYVGLVASARRAVTVVDQLRADGHDEETLARLRAPAGLDLGSLGNAEIAVAILADLVAREARGELDLRHPGPAERPTAVDPICGMTVHPDEARYHSLRHGIDHWFCSSGCKREWDGGGDLAP